MKLGQSSKQKNHSSLVQNSNFKVHVHVVNFISRKSQILFYTNIKTLFIKRIAYRIAHVYINKTQPIHVNLVND